MIHISDYKWSDYTLKTVGYSEGQISIENLRGSFQLSMREIDVQIMANHFGYELVKNEKEKEVYTMPPSLKGEDALEVPYPDFEGNKLCQGDWIKHPDGTVGQIFFEMNYEATSHEWFVHYDSNGRSRLSIQVGDKGRAVKMTETEYLMQGKNGERLHESINQFDRGEAREYINGELVPIEIYDLSKLNGFMSPESEGDTGE